MGDPESDYDFRARLNRVVSEGERTILAAIAGRELDDLGRKYDRFRIGVPLRGIESSTADADVQLPFCHDDGFPP